MFSVGDMVFWNDPDDHMCSGVFRIVEIRGETYRLQDPEGSLVEANADELEPRPTSPVSRMVKHRVTVEMEFTFDVYAPPDFDAEKIEELAEALTHPGSGWELPQPEARLISSKLVDVPSDECLMEGRSPTECVFTREDAYVVDDDGKEIVNPEEASWWLTIRPPPEEGSPMFGASDES